MQQQSIDFLPLLQQIGLTNQVLVSRYLDMGCVDEAKQLFMLDCEFKWAVDEEFKYDPNQPRAPAGTPIGGQWIAEGGGTNRAAPKSSKARYKPEDDEWYQAGIYASGYQAYAQLHFYSDFVENQAKEYNIDPNLIRGVILNESITRLGGGLIEASLSATLSNYGTYGPAQLGPEARALADLNIIESLTTPGAIIGAANFLSLEKQRLVEEGIENPTNGQIATRYNRGSWNSSKPITKYGIRVEYLIDRFYKN